VFIARAEAYGVELLDPVTRGLRALGFGFAEVRGKSVVLKPNLVEPRRSAPHVNTHPEIVCAVAEAFRRWDARSVVVAEGPGHERDIEYVLEESGFGRVLRSSGLEFVDLNHDETRTVENRFQWTRMGHLELPETILRGDIVVSIAKLKTHHWAGATLSMKNLFGVMPGARYGWPKNLLHHAGIHESILDITAAVRPGLAIIDGVIGMEGDGPIMGEARAANVLVMGRNAVSVDATAARLMGMDPREIGYLAGACGLGPIEERAIMQLGERLVAPLRRFAPPPGGG
jgi:uncharacterized protein (DUF362 family)